MILLSATPHPAFVADRRPVVPDATVMAMRPTARSVATITIAADGSGDYTTFRAAILAGAAAQDAARVAAGLTYGQLTPNFGVTYLVKPGTYAPADAASAPPAIHPWAWFYATDPTRGNTVLRWGIEPSGGFYWEGIDIVCVDNAGQFDPKYAIHLHASATNIVTRCTLSNVAPSSGGYPTPIGVDGYVRSTLVMHDVDFITGTYTNIHGATGTFTPPMTTVFSKCRFSGGSLYWWALDDTDPAELWAVGSTANAVGCVGAATKLHLDPANVLTRTDVNVGARSGHYSTAGGALTTGTTDARTDWPVPTGGLSAADRAYYGM